jgi:hypothetical protein
MRDTSNRLVKADQVKALRNFQRSLDKGEIGRKEVEELGAIIDKEGTDSVAYDQYLSAYKRMPKGE